MEPPGGTFRCELLHGFTVQSSQEIDAIIKTASDAFQGTSYNLLGKNCNHFTSYLVEQLTGRPAPGWLNRAASIGVALPCVVPKEWIAPPDYETADGELVDEQAEEHTTERSRMLGDDSREVRSLEDIERADESTDDEWDSDEDQQYSGRGKGKGRAPPRDTSGRVMPPAERAPPPGHKMSG